MSTEQEKQPPPHREKKAYDRPRLVNLGALAALTQLQMQHGNHDGGTGHFMAS